MNFTIKQKLMILTGFILLGLAGLYIENSVNQNKNAQLVKMKSRLQDVQLSILQLRRSEKDFMLRSDEKYRNRFNTTTKQTALLLSLLETDLKLANINIDKIKALSSSLAAYNALFNDLVDASITKGLTKTSGSYGGLRAASSELEKTINQLNDLASYVDLLMLRRHEKDFMLRHDDTYVDKVYQVSDILNEKLNSTHSKALLNRYLNEFKQFVDISQKIGLDANSGIQGDMRAVSQKMEKDLEAEIVRLNNYITSHMKSAQVSHITITLLISAFMIFAVLVISKQIITPLAVFSNRITQIQKENNLSQRCEESHDEIGVIAKEFNSLMAHFQSLIKSINTTVDSLSDSTNVVSKSVEETSKGISEQAIQSDMVATAVAEMGMTANEIANNAHLTRNKTDEVSVKIVEGKTKLDNTVININNLSQKLINAGDEIVNLQDQSNGISSVLEVIKSIADQTNLLALNAAIEAARAGEQGRGFAVVADEVRTLAVRTQSSTAEITSIISELQAKTSDIVVVVNNCKEQGIESVQQATQTEAVLNEIISDIDVITDMTVQVATAVEQQSNVVQGVDINIVQIRDIGEQVACDSQSNATASKNVAKLAKDLFEEANVFKI
ncbi:methyl-accepting chemotaxis protein [Pseudoalteromonas sp. C2R02]|uniref:methyl-accepting chemotaxis protein n=1 Tax=Pseudoalteromonas sp. C2R02 TaxID=2841565 RepID=UPI001C094618|nr:methyl-accepting chemotaxis protein [Pseudoalteromonas sp. C2R02]MBU2972560.1 methyl-accepting chemotaxis protein [Pseudoalteromonas sp. C2R02]